MNDYILEQLANERRARVRSDVAASRRAGRESSVLAIATLLIATVIAAFSPEDGRAGVAGTVRDDRNVPVANASVTLTASTGRYGAFTDARGRFVIRGLRVDSYTIRVRKDGFADSVLLNVGAFGDEVRDVGTILLRGADFMAFSVPCRA